jgi:hypothetical protein
MNILTKTLLSNKVVYVIGNTEKERYYVFKKLISDTSEIIRYFPNSLHQVSNINYNIILFYSDLNDVFVETIYGNFKKVDSNLRNTKEIKNVYIPINNKIFPRGVTVILPPPIKHVTDIEYLLQVSNDKNYIINCKSILWMDAPPYNEQENFDAINKIYEFSLKKNTSWQISVCYLTNILKSSATDEDSNISSNIKFKYPLETFEIDYNNLSSYDLQKMLLGERNILKTSLKVIEREIEHVKNSLENIRTYWENYHELFYDVPLMREENIINDTNWIMDYQNSFVSLTSKEAIFKEWKKNLECLVFIGDSQRMSLLKHCMNFIEGRFSICTFNSLENELIVEIENIMTEIKIKADAKVNILDSLSYVKELKDERDLFRKTLKKITTEKIPEIIFRKIKQGLEKNLNNLEGVVYEENNL